MGGAITLVVHLTPESVTEVNGSPASKPMHPESGGVRSLPFCIRWSVAVTVLRVDCSAVVMVHRMARQRRGAFALVRIVMPHFRILWAIYVYKWSLPRMGAGFRQHSVFICNLTLWKRNLLVSTET